MKTILTALAIFLSFAVSAQEARLNGDTQELIIKFDKKPSTTKQGRLLQAILQNSETIRLKDGTVISVKDLTDQTNIDNGKLEDLEKAFHLSTGGSGTGGGG